MHLGKKYEKLLKKLKYKKVISLLAKTNKLKEKMKKDRNIELSDTFSSSSSGSDNTPRFGEQEKIEFSDSKHEVNSIEQAIELSLIK